MKQEFIEPEVEVIVLAESDVITASGGESEDDL